jgi:predicted membrane GTPase involved in stress response
VTAYALDAAQQRGRLFVKPGDQVYEGQVVGIYQRAGDLKVRVCFAWFDCFLVWLKAVDCWWDAV